MRQPPSTRPPLSQPAPVRTPARRPRAVLVALGPAAILLAFLWPIVAGRETWFLRDLFNYHFAAKAVQARAMRGGFLPLIDPFRAGGQAMVGNLNNVSLYPDNLLYLVAPTTWALNAHLWLHLLLAPIAVYWLARRLDVAREAAWVAGFCYALSGFFLSQLNLYNLVAGAALAPAFAALCLAAAGGRRPALAASGAGALWALLLVAGDPIVAALALLVGAVALLAKGGLRYRRLPALGLALALGSVVAAPQIVELLRVMGSSYRGGLGLSADSRMVSSWDPRTVVELLVPLFFGPPDQRYWGELVLGSARPLFFSLYPGLVTVALVCASGRPRSSSSRCAWSMILIGGFMALGGWNPLMFYLYRLPQAAALRYPIKAWLLVAIGASLLAGIGFERVVLRGLRRSFYRALAAVALVVGGAWLALTRWNVATVDALEARIVPHFPARLAAEEVARWRGALLISLVLVTVAGVLVFAFRRSPRLAGSALLSLHVVGQFVLLRPLLDTDLTVAYSTPPRALAYLDPGERIAHGCTISFACELGRAGGYPDWRMSWIERRGWLELYPFAGAQFGLRYAYNTSPEGLDTLFVFAGGRALRDLDDTGALRLLAASGVDVVLLGRAVEGAARDRVSLRARLPSIAGEVWIYEILDRAEEVRLAARIRSGDTRRVLLEILAPDFDPVRDVFLPGRPEGIVDTGGGTAVLESEGWERLRIGTDGPKDGLLVLARAWLPLYRASVDGRQAATLQANMGLLAVEVPAGAHDVEIWVDRGPWRAALWAALIGATGLCVLAFRGVRSPRESAAACQTPERSGESTG